MTMASTTVNSFVRGGAETPARDAVRTKALLLEAAAREFARFGLSGARVDRIAEQAGVNVRMLYYYFKSKDELFLAVLERAYTVIRESEKALQLDQVDPEEGIRRLESARNRFSGQVAADDDRAAALARLF